MAARTPSKSASVEVSPKGHVFTQDSIGEVMATRSLLEVLQRSGEYGGGPAPFGKTNRSRFLSRLDETLQALRPASRW